MVKAGELQGYELHCADRVMGEIEGLIHEAENPEVNRLTHAKSNDDKPESAGPAKNPA